MELNKVDQTSLHVRYCAIWTVTELYYFNSKGINEGVYLSLNRKLCQGLLQDWKKHNENKSDHFNLLLSHFQTNNSASQTQMLHLKTEVVSSVTSISLWCAVVLCASLEYDSEIMNTLYECDPAIAKHIISRYWS